MAACISSCRIGAHAIRRGRRQGRAGCAAVLDGGGTIARGWRASTKSDLQRRGFSAETIAAIKSAIRTLFFSKLLREEAIAKTLEEYGEFAEVRRLIDFIKQLEARSRWPRA